MIALSSYQWRPDFEWRIRGPHLSSVHCSLTERFTLLAKAHGHKKMNIEIPIRYPKSVLCTWDEGVWKTSYATKDFESWRATALKLEKSLQRETTEGAVGQKCIVIQRSPTARTLPPVPREYTDQEGPKILSAGAHVWGKSVVSQRMYNFNSSKLECNDFMHALTELLVQAPSELHSKIWSFGRDAVQNLSLDYEGIYCLAIDFVAEHIWAELAEAYDHGTERDEFPEDAVGVPELVQRFKSKKFRDLRRGFHQQTGKTLPEYRRLPESELEEDYLEGELEDLPGYERVPECEVQPEVRAKPSQLVCQDCKADRGGFCTCRQRLAIRMNQDRRISKLHEYEIRMKIPYILQHSLFALTSMIDRCNLRNDMFAVCAEEVAATEAFSKVKTPPSGTKKISAKTIRTQLSEINLQPCQPRRGPIPHYWRWCDIHEALKECQNGSREGLTGDMTDVIMPRRFPRKAQDEKYNKWRPPEV